MQLIKFECKRRPIIKRWLPPIVLFATMFYTESAFSDDPAYQIKASYIYNILKFVRFPSEADSMINVCVLGENRFGSALEDIDQAPLAKSTINISYLGRYTSGTSFHHCDVLYLVESEKKLAPNILARVNQSKTLTIGEHVEFIPDGGLIELFEYNDTIQFRIDPAKVNVSEYKIDAQLVELGVRQRKPQ